MIHGSPNGETHLKILGKSFWLSDLWSDVDGERSPTAYRPVWEVPIQGGRASPVVRRAHAASHGTCGTSVSENRNGFQVSIIRYLHLNKIGCKKRTQGTETSKYLQERTSTETPQVVASERGPGQWQLKLKRNILESLAVAGDSPVRVDTLIVLE